MAAWRTWSVLVGMLAPVMAFGQTYNLSEAPTSGECYRINVATALNGSMKISQDGKESAIKLSAKNEHVFLERVLSAGKGVVRKSARYYEIAAASGDIGEAKFQRGLRDERRLIVAQRIDDNLLSYSPAGPLTRQELEVVAEHFDTLHLTGILPGKEVAIEDSWKVPNATVQALCLFDGLISQNLTAKLKGVKDGNAVIAIEGKSNGIELGAAVELEIKATVQYDLLNHRIVSLEWKQKDSRKPGPASPAVDVESTTTLKRALLADEPKELSKAALAGVPQEDEPNELLKQLQFKDPSGRYSMIHSRDWHIVGQTDNHLVLRLLDRGDFIGQATVAVWKKADAGKHLSADDFKKIVSESPGWEMEEIVDSGEVPTEEGRWIYRVTAKGELDGTKVVQNFLLLAGPKGDQVIVTFTVRPANAAKLGTRDVALVNALDFAAKK
jgi:hypothetical protein